jgi:hypothetical protein
MGNPYVQVALTYARRWRLIGYGVLLLAVISPTAASIVFEKESLQDLLLKPFIPFFAACLFMALASHVRQQFAHCRSHLMPGFRRVHLAVATVVVFIVAILTPAIFTWLTGLHSVGLVALTLMLFSANLWITLAASTRLGATLWLFQAAGWGALFADSFRNAVAQFAQGRFEPSAVALLIVGIVTTALGLRKMAQLNEDAPWYHGWADISAEQYRIASERAAGKRSSRPGRRERCEERRMAKLIEHARQAPVSWWSGVRRWQVMMGIGRSSWLIWLVATFVTLLLGTWFTKGRSGILSTGGILQNLVVYPVLAIFPIPTLLGQFVQRQGMAGRELLLPVERGLYLRQLGTAAAISQLHCWSAASVAALFWWLVVARESVSGSAIAGMILIGALSQVWLFAGAVWFMRLRHRTMAVVPVVLVAFATGILLPIVTNGFTAAPRLAEWRGFIWTAAGFLTLFGTFLIWAAYRRWLVADFDITRTWLMPNE